MLKKHRIDTSAGTANDVDLTPTEEADRVADEAASAAIIAADEAAEQVETDDDDTTLNLTFVQTFLGYRAGELQTAIANAFPTLTGPEQTRLAQLALIVQRLARRAYRDRL